MQYRSVYLAVNLAIASLAYAAMASLPAMEHLPSYIWLEQAIGGLAKGGVAVLIVSGVALLFQSTNLICSVIVERLPFSRTIRRVLSGANFIEGDWPLIVVYGQESPEPGKLIYIGFLRVEYRDNDHYVRGDDWRPDGVHAVSFESIRSSFCSDRNERRLQYFYRQGETWQDARMRGYTEIYFFPIHTRSEVHAGQFRDAEHNDVRFYARRKVYSFGERRIRSAEQKKAAAQAVWAEFEPMIKTMITQPISADWR